MTSESEFRKFARKFAAAHDWPKAEHAWRDYLALAPGNPEATGGLAEALLRQRLVDEAEEVISSVLPLNPTDMRLLVPWALIALARKDDARAIARWERVAEVNSNYFAPHLHLGKLYQMQGNVDLARAHFDKARQLEPDRFDLFLPLARFCAATGKQDDAGHYYSRHLAAQPDPVVALEAAELMLKNGRAHDASELLQDSGDVSVDKVRWLTARLDCDISLQRWAAALQRIAALAESAPPEIVEERGLNLLASLPDGNFRKLVLPKFVNSLGLSAVKLAARAESEGDLATALSLLDLCATSKEVMYRRASVLKEMNYLRTAVDICERLLIEFPEDQLTLDLLARIKYAAQDWIGVIDVFRWRGRLSSATANDYAMAGHALAALGELDEAEDTVLSGLQLDPGQGALYFVLGLIALWQGRYMIAASYFDHSDVAEIADPQAKNFQQLAQWMIEESPFDTAPGIVAETMEALATGSFDFVTRHNGKARLKPVNDIRQLRLAGELDAAAEAAYAAVLQAPTPSRLFDELLLTLCALGRTNEATDFLTKHPEYFNSAQFVRRAGWILANLQFSSGNTARAFAFLYNVESVEVLRYQLRTRALDAGAHDLDTGSGTLILVGGDRANEINWSRFYPTLSNRFSNLSMTCDPRLQVLLQRSFPQITMVPVSRWMGAEAIPPASEATTYTGLPHLAASRLLDTRGWALAKSFDRVDILADVLVKTLPQADERASTPYLVTNIQKREIWRNRLSSLSDRPKIGISWLADNRLRNEFPACSIQLAAWRPLLTLPEVDIIFLDETDSSGDLAELKLESENNLYELSDLDPGADLDNTAALLQELDLIVSVVNEISELAGAVGATCWLVSTIHLFDWRVSESGNDLLYPSHTHFFATSSHDLDSLMDSIALRIVDHVEHDRRHALSSAHNSVLEV